MANKLNSLAHTKWLCKYHIVFILKYRRKIIYNQYRKDLRDYIKLLCQYKGVRIIEGHLMGYLSTGIDGYRCHSHKCGWYFLCKKTINS